MRNAAFGVCLLGVTMTGTLAADPPPASPGALCEGWQIQSSAQVDVPDAAVSTTAFRPDGWHAARVPTTVVAALVADGTLPDPHFGMNLRAFPGVSYPIGENFSNLEMPADSPYAVPWWFRRELTLGAVGSGRRVWLRLDGINYAADVWLNGHRVATAAQTAGAMRTHELDVTDAARPDARNVLALKVVAPAPSDLAITFVDWNPLPPDKLMGLYRDVSVTTSGPVTVRHPLVVTRLDQPERRVARLTVIADLLNAGRTAVSGRLEGDIGGRRFGRDVALAAGERKTVRFAPDSHPALIVEQPELWWPVSMGAQALHDLDLTFTIDGAVSDTAHLRFGMREITSELTSAGHLVFRVNGERVLIRGAGYTPEMTLSDAPERQEAELTYVRDMNLNTVRLEGKLEDDHFLGLCDRMGILVLAGWCCCDTWEKWETWKEGNLDVAVASQRSQIRRLRGHPSLLAWMNGSDGPPPAEVERAYLRVLEQLHWPNPVVSSATQKPAELSGPSGVKMLGPYEYVPPVYWYQDKTHGGAYGFNTETGPGPAVPPVESLRKMLPAESLWPINEQWLYHAGGGPFGSIDVFNAALEARYGKPDGIEDYARTAQMLAYETHRAMFEAFRRNKYTSTGVIQWMLNNAWPSLIWHLYDFYLRPGGSYFGAKEANEPLHVQYSYDDRSVVVVNATRQSHSGLRVRARVLDLDSHERAAFATTLDIEADGSHVALTLPAPEAITPTYFLWLGLDDRNGRNLSSNFYWLSTTPDVLDFEHSKWYVTPVKTHADLTALRRLPKARLDVSSKHAVESGHGVTRVTLVNPSKHLAFGVRLQLLAGAGGDEVLPILWEDNYVALLPGETREIAARYATAHLGGQKPRVTVEAWNADVTER